MPVAYPSDLPLAKLLGKSRERPASFAVTLPRQGFGHVERTGEDTPVTWEVSWTLSQAQAQTFWEWFTNDTQRGVLPVSMQIRTEFGLVEHVLQFEPDGLLPATALGGGAVWEYRARMSARTLLEA